MIKLQIQAKFDGIKGEYKSFTVYLKFTDGIEPILITDNFGEVLSKIQAVQKAIPQTTNYDVEFI